MKDIKDQQAVFVEAEAIVKEWADKGVPEKEHAQQIAISLVLERDKVADWKSLYFEIKADYECLQVQYHHLQQRLK